MLLRLDGAKLDAIKGQHVSNEACLQAVVKAFLLGEGYYQSSWRRVIHALHEAGESRLDEEIKINAEQQQGEWAGHSKIFMQPLHDIFDQE